VARDTTRSEKLLTSDNQGMYRPGETVSSLATVHIIVISEGREAKHHLPPKYMFVGSRPKVAASTLKQQAGRPRLENLPYTCYRPCPLHGGAEGK